MRNLFLFIFLFCGCYNPSPNKIDNQKDIDETIEYVRFLKAERKKLIEKDNERTHRQIVGGVKSIDSVIKRYEDCLLIIKISSI